MLLINTLHVPYVELDDVFFIIAFHSSGDCRWICQAIGDNIDAQLFDLPLGALHKFGYFNNFIAGRNILILEQLTVHCLAIERHQVIVALFYFIVIYLAK